MKRKQAVKKLLKRHYSKLKRSKTVKFNQRIIGIADAICGSLFNRIVDSIWYVMKEATGYREPFSGTISACIPYPKSSMNESIVLILKNNIKSFKKVKKVKVEEDDDYCEDDDE